MNKNTTKTAAWQRFGQAILASIGWPQGSAQNTQAIAGASPIEDSPSPPPGVTQMSAVIETPLKISPSVCNSCAAEGTLRVLEYSGAGCRTKCNKCGAVEDPPPFTFSDGLPGQQINASFTPAVIEASDSASEGHQANDEPEEVEAKLNDDPEPCPKCNRVGFVTFGARSGDGKNLFECQKCKGVWKEGPA